MFHVDDDDFERVDRGLPDNWTHISVVSAPHLSVLGAHLTSTFDGAWEYQTDTHRVEGGAVLQSAVSALEAAGPGLIPRSTPEQRAAWEAARVAEHEAVRAQRRDETAAVQARSLALLEAKIGADAIAKIKAGGGYLVPSKRWKDVTYCIPRDPHNRIQVLDRGRVVTDSCLVTTAHDLPWPDVMLQRITAVELDESVVYATGVTTAGHGLFVARSFSWWSRVFDYVGPILAGFAIAGVVVALIVALTSAPRCRPSTGRVWSGDEVVNNWRAMHDPAIVWCKPDGTPP